jgi:hypothetical protein
MNDSDATRGARKSLAIVLTLGTAVGSVLWVLPKSGEGGLAWLLSLPAAIMFPYLTYRLVAPPRAPRSAWVPVGLAISLGVLWFGGLVIASNALPGPVLSELGTTIVATMIFWPIFVTGALIIIGVLKISDRASARRATRAASAAPAPAQPVMPGSPAHLTGSSPPVDPGQRPREHAPEQQHPVLAPQRSAASPAPAPMTYRAPESAAAGARATETSSASAPAEGERTGGSPTLSGISFLELSTLVEIAASLEDADNPTMMLLTFTDGGIEVTAAETEIGTVAGSWSGTATVRTLQSARSTLEALSGLEPAPSTVTLRPPVSDLVDLEVLADTAQNVSVEAVRA